MSINLGQSVALAIETVCALLANSGAFREWYDKRATHFKHFSKKGSGLFADIDSYSKGRMGRHIKSFNKSVRGLRITKIDTPAWVDNREIHLHLGDEENESVVILIVVLWRAEDKTEHEPWYHWELSCEDGIRCSKHPDEKFSGKIIFGLYAFNQEKVSQL